MLKILVCCFNPRSLNNIHHGFMEAGCDVKALFFGWQYADKTDLLVQRLTEALDRYKPDLVYTYGWWDIGINLDGYLQAIRRKGIFHVYWAYDDPVCFENISLPIAKGADLVFTTVRECITEYRKQGINAYLLLHGCYPGQHKRVHPKDELTHDIVLLANNYNIYENPLYFEHRIHGMNSIIKPLADADFDIRVWGLWWTHWDRGYVLPEKFHGGVLPKGMESIVYSSCKIALGLQTVGTSKTHFSVRTFEVMGCGAFHLSQYSPALEIFFKKGVHMEWTRSADETLEIVKFYLSREKAREKVARKGQQEVYEKHTIVQRARYALGIINKYVKKP